MQALLRHLPFAGECLSSSSCCNEANPHALLVSQQIDLTLPARAADMHHPDATQGSLLAATALSRTHR